MDFRQPVLLHVFSICLSLSRFLSLLHGCLSVAASFSISLSICCIDFSLLLRDFYFSLCFWISLDCCTCFDFSLYFCVHFYTLLCIRFSLQLQLSID